MPSPKTSTPEEQENDGESILKWIESLAKVIVVITALLYIVGRRYTESYYAHMGLPTSTIPLTLHEYLFMSTRSLSFLKSAVSTSVISVLTGLFFSIAVNGVTTVMDVLVRKFTKGSEEKQRNEQTVSESNENDDDVENPELEKTPKEASNNRDLIPEFRSRLQNWLKGRLIYIIPTFVVLVFLMLLPSAEASGSVDSEYDIQNAPLGRILLSQPSIPELSFQTYVAQKDENLYDYGILPVVGTLGNNYLFVLENQSGKKSVLSVPVAQVVSINYVNYTSLTPTPTITNIPATSPAASETATP
jgi:hypothetical protein